MIRQDPSQTPDPIESILALARLRGLEIDRAEAELLGTPLESQLGRLARLAAALAPRAAPLPTDLPERPAGGR